MNELEVFNFNEHQVRTVLIDSEPYFVGKDVAVALGYNNPRDAISKHIDEEDKGVAKCDTLGGTQELTVINERGVYALVFGSKLPQAKKFKHWVTHDVLPSIRKHGAYMTPQTVEDLLTNPDTIIQLATSLKEERSKRLELEKQVEDAKPKLEYFDKVASTNDAVSLEYVAKTINYEGVGRNTLIKILRNHGVLKDDNIPYQRFIDNRCFKTVQHVWEDSQGNIHPYYKTLVYQKGIAYICKLLDNLGYERMLVI